MSRLCRQLIDELGFDCKCLARKGKVIRDLAIELDWDNDKFDGIDQDLLNRVAGFYQESNEAFALEHWGVSWQQLLPPRPASPAIYVGPHSPDELLEMRRLMVSVIRGLHLPWRLRRQYFSYTKP